MTDSSSPFAETEGTITDVVAQFLEMARSSEIDSPGSSTRQADLTYQLDSLVSDFLDQNQISSEEYNSLEQEVLNSVAEELVFESEQNDTLDLSADDQGNYKAESVLAAIDLDLGVVDDLNNVPSIISDGFDGLDV